MSKLQPSGEPPVDPLQCAVRKEAAGQESSVFVTGPLKTDLAVALQVAWRRYTELLGEPPHGTLKQMKAFVELMRIDAFVEGIANHAVAKWYAEGHAKEAERDQLRTQHEHDVETGLDLHRQLCEHSNAAGTGKYDQLRADRDSWRTAYNGMEREVLKLRAENKLVHELAVQAHTEWLLYDPSCIAKLSDRTRLAESYLRWIAQAQEINQLRAKLEKAREFIFLTKVMDFSGLSEDELLKAQRNVAERATAVLAELEAQVKESACELVPSPTKRNYEDPKG